MSPAYYRLSIAFATSLLMLALAGCGGTHEAQTPAGPKVATAATDSDSDIDTEATLWTILGVAKKESQRQPGPQTGETVSPVLWQAAHDTLNFVPTVSEDPLTGVLVTDWYSPKGKPDERFQIHVYILDRALKSNSFTIEVQRQVRSAGGGWADAPVERKLAESLEDDILRRARQLKQAWTEQPS